MWNGPNINPTEVNLDAIRGSMLGGAVGDALGYPVEFMSWELIQIIYGDGGIQEYALDPETGKALISDDTQMTLFTACGLLFGQSRMLTRGGDTHLSSYVHAAYLDWLSTQSEEDSPQNVSWILTRSELHSRRAPGNSCLAALQSGKIGTMVNPINDSKGCGGVMRVAPIGLFYPDWRDEAQMELLDREGAEVAAITHGHPLGYIPAAFLTHVIHMAAFFKNEFASLVDIVRDALQMTGKLFGSNAYFTDFRDLVERAISLSGNNKRDVGNVNALGEGWVAEETVAIAIYCALRYENDFSKGVIAAVNHPGDSDSTGAITGNILGAWLGFERIEEKWKQNLELSDVILELADDLCRSCLMCEYSSCTDADWRRKYVDRS